MEKETQAIVIALVVGLILCAAVILFYQSKPDIPQPTPEPQKNYCNPESRLATTCIVMDQPACGWFNASQVQCIKYPCAQTYQNWCNACVNEQVDYWTEGVCPE